LPPDSPGTTAHARSGGPVPSLDHPPSAFFDWIGSGGGQGSERDREVEVEEGVEVVVGGRYWDGWRLKKGRRKERKEGKKQKKS
jgi:hypothetical protein